MFMMMAILILPITASVSVFGYEMVYVDSSEEELSEGVTLLTDKCLTTDGFLSYNVLLVDAKDEDISLEILRKKDDFRGLSPVNDMLAGAENVIAGVNSSFFSHSAKKGESIGVEAQDGRYTYFLDMYNTSEKGAANFIINKDAKYFDYISMDVTLKDKKDVDIGLAGINVLSVHGMPVIFTRSAFKDSDSVKKIGDLSLTLVEDGIIKGPVEENIVLDENNYLIGIGKQRAADYVPFLEKGKELELSYKSNINVEDVELALAGGGILIRDGKFVDEGLKVSAGARHPRTAMGINRRTDEIVFLTIDGRGTSIGATNKEAAEILLSFGVDEAISFDGGGSTTMAKRDFFTGGAEVLNRVSDGAPRPVINGLGVAINREKEEESLKLRASSDYTFVNNGVKLDVSLIDQNGNKLDMDESALTFSIDRDAVIKDRDFIPYEAGTFTVTAEYKGERASVDIEVADKLVDIVVEPKVVSGKTEMKFLGIDDEGHSVSLSTKQLSFNMTDDLGSFDGDTFKAKGKAGQVEVSYKGIKDYFYVAPESKKDSLFDFEKMNIRNRVFPDWVQGEGYLDKGMVNIDYDFVASEESQAVYAYLDDAVIKTAQDELIIKGMTDGDEVMIKAVFVDDEDETYKVDLHFEDGEAICTMPKMAYPVNLARVYAVTLKTEEAKSGWVVIKDIIGRTAGEYEGVIVDVPPYDEYYKAGELDDYSKIGVFGPSKRKDMLLDNIVLEKVYQDFNKLDAGVFLGESDISKDRLETDTYVLDGKYSSFSKKGITFINLDTKNYSFLKADGGQFDKMMQTLKTTPDDVIVISGRSAIFEYIDTDYYNEETLFHRVLSDFSRISGKTIFYVNTATLTSKIAFYEGIRYIDLNGIYCNSDDKMNLHDSYKMLVFYKDGRDFYYSLDELYPYATVKDGE